MINYIYQLVSPRVFSIKYEDIVFDDKIIIKPAYMSVCHADQRYYLGMRDTATLRKKLPMALIHECCGQVVFDKTGTYKKGQNVVMIPNVPNSQSDYIYENYAKGSYFLSSGHDGFMRELVCMPKERIVPFDNIDYKVASIAEFVSVGMHALNRFIKVSHINKEKVGIWGDGSLAYVVACIIKSKLPDTKVVVIGKDTRKLALFSFVDETYVADNIPKDLNVDHAFECAGGEGSYFAIDDIIRYINPQGTVMLMGVSENKVPINTRNVLEKGLTFVGCSRSGKEDFEAAIDLMKSSKVQSRLGSIIYEDKPVRSINDIHRILETDLRTPFKTVFKWEL